MNELALDIVEIILEVAIGACAVALGLATWANHADRIAEDRESKLDGWIKDWVGKAGIDADPKAVKIWSGTGGIGALFAMLALGVEPRMAVLGVIAVGLLLVVALMVRAKRTAANFSGQLGDALPVVAAGLRSGLSLGAALESYCTEAENPIKSELRRVSRDVGVGIPFHEALDAMSVRMSSRDAKQLAIAVRIQAKTGSGLADIIDHIAGSIKERERLRAKARSLTSTNRMSAKLLTALPILLLTFFILTNEQFHNFYLGEGMFMLFVLGGMLLVGSLLLHKIADFKVD